MVGVRCIRVSYINSTCIVSYVASMDDKDLKLYYDVAWYFCSNYINMKIVSFYTVIFGHKYTAQWRDVNFTSYLNFMSYLN